MKIENPPIRSIAQDTSICVLGLGYVGLTLASVLADVGYRVTGIDPDEKLIRTVCSGRAQFHEKGLDEMLRTLASRSAPPKFEVSLSGPCADVYVITVGTPILRPSLEPNLDYVRRATSEVARVLKQGDMVILRSTVPVGVTRAVALRILEELSSLRGGVDFDLAFCPERTVEGKALKELRELPQIIGGLNRASADRAARLFQRSTQTIIDVGELEAAEMLKIMDNTYRDVMFAYANQMALLCEALGLDMVPIVRAANQGYNRNRIPVPSPGVGGACLSKDPYILASVCRRVGIDPILFIHGRRVNEFMPQHVVSRVGGALNGIGKKLHGSTVLVLGFAFKGKPETSDMRDSPTLELTQALIARGARVLGHDPLVREEEIRALGVEVVSIEEGFASADAVIIMLDHQAYEEMDIAGLAGRARRPLVIMDGWHLFNQEDMNRIPGLIYQSIGK